jgi:hypothetical protein
MRYAKLRRRNRRRSTKCCRVYVLPWLDDIAASESGTTLRAELGLCGQEGDCGQSHPVPIFEIPHTYPRDTPSISSGYPIPILEITHPYPRDTPPLSSRYPIPILVIPSTYPRDTPPLSSGYLEPIPREAGTCPRMAKRFRGYPAISQGCPDPSQPYRQPVLGCPATMLGKLRALSAG